jgi:hypothetical protein
MNVTHKTGFLFQSYGGSSFEGEVEVFFEPCESWHRTLRGAWKARERNGHGGRIYRLLSSDHSELVPE